MGRITDEDVQRVRDATDLISLVSERIVLKQKGRLFWGLCPFHGEKTPSLKVDPATQLWHCFGCSRGGDAFGFIIESDQVDFPDAVRILADRARIEITEEAGGVPRGRKERLLAASEDAAEYYARVLTGSTEPGPAKARDYLAKRGFGSDVAKRWHMGFAPGRGALVRHLAEKGFSAEELVEANLALKGDKGPLKDRFYERVMFPITDLQGRTIAFGGRVIGTGEPKYLNTSDTPLFKKSANLYAIDRAKAAITSTGTAVVVEGYTDVIALHEAGITNVVATLGTALTRQHVKLLGRFAKKIVYLFDGDAAGMRAADAAADFIDRDLTPEAGESRVDLLVAIIPEGKDPADFVSEHGAEALSALLQDASPLLRFSIDRRLARWELDRPEERSRALREAAEVLAPVKDSILADDYANYIADRLMADFGTVRRAIAQARAQTPARSTPDEQPGEPVAPPPESTRARTERELIALVTSTPQLRSRAWELLSPDLLSEPEHLLIAEAVREAGEEVSTDDLVGKLEQLVPGSAKLLSAATVKDTSGEPDALADSMVRRLKEFELERRIAIGKAQLRSPNSFANSSEYDDVFREVSSLQRRLDALRRSEFMTDNQLEAQE